MILSLTFYDPPLSFSPALSPSSRQQPSSSPTLPHHNPSRHLPGLTPPPPSLQHSRRPYQTTTISYISHLLTFNNHHHLFPTPPPDHHQTTKKRKLKPETSKDRFKQNPATTTIPHTTPLPPSSLPSSSSIKP